MALYKDHNITIDIKRTPRIALQNIVRGETGNRLIVVLTNDDIPIELDSSYHVILRIETAEGVVRQDATIDDGKAYVILSGYSAGLNRARFEIYTTETETDDTFIKSAEFQFTADADEESENAWRRGSTPIHTFTSDVDLSGATIEVTYEQNKKVVCTKHTADMTITTDSVSWMLTADETLAMEVGNVYVQLKYTKNGVTDVSDRHIGKVLYTQGV